LLIVGENERDARTVQQACLFHVFEVDDTITARAKERGAVQPAFTFTERSADNDHPFGHNDAGAAAARFQKPDPPSESTSICLSTEKDEVVGASKRSSCSWVGLLDSSCSK
jgi:hypothetical protein